ncbi:mechanosensitive ion channel family protein [Bacteriovoracales bacterium]|nr:mechanosensitive ion channel family protein [Bacteriovoracales bacterium]
MTRPLVFEKRDCLTRDKTMKKKYFFILFLFIEESFAQTSPLKWIREIDKHTPDWMDNWLGLLAFLALALLAVKIVRNYLTDILFNFIQKHALVLPEEKKKKLLFPLSCVVFFGINIAGIGVLNFPEKTANILLRGCYVTFTIAIVAFCFHIVDIISLYLEKWALETKSKFDDILIPLIRKTTRFVVIIVGAVFIGNSLTIDMKSIIAGLGIGGIAFALAAKDTLSNIFGSLTVLVDRPFSIGDWVVIDGETEGTVEDVGLRSTRIRTFYDSLITVPNGQLTNLNIDNFGQRQYRRFRTRISIEYSTPPEKIEAFCEGIRQIISKHRWTRKDYFHVYLNELGASALDILVYVFWRVPDWSTELQERHRLLLDIIRLAKDMDVEFAFPTQTLHLFNEEKAEKDIDPSLAEDIPPHLYGLSKANTITAKPMTTSRPRSGNINEKVEKEEISL